MGENRKEALNRLDKIEYKLAVFEHESNREYLPQTGTRFVHDFINWMSKNALSNLYSMEYIDPETLERKFEIGNRVKTSVSDNNKSIYYDAKHVDSDAFDFSEVNRKEMIEKLQDLEDSIGSRTFDMKFKIMQVMRINTYNQNKREEKSIPAGFPLKQES